MKEVALALYDSLYDKVLRLKHNKFVSHWQAF